MDKFLVNSEQEFMDIFKEMEIAIGQEILKLIPQVKQNEVFFSEPVKLVETTEVNTSPVVPAPKQVDIPRDASGNKIGRNDPCFCGSGKKFKNCHGK